MSDDIKGTSEVQKMREQLAEVRRNARGVKDSARGLRRPSSTKLAEIAATDVEQFDASHPSPRPNTGEITKPLP